MLYTTLKFLHVLLTIIAVGFNMTFGVLLTRAAKAGPDGRELKYALSTVKLMSRIANACYLLVALSGIAMVHAAGYSWSFKWIHGSAALFVVAFALALFVMAPMLKRRTAILDARGTADPEFVKLSKRSAMLGALLSLITLTIIWLMVSKPA
jgi:uncharacterized membrane protein